MPQPDFNLDDFDPDYPLPGHWCDTHGWQPYCDGECMECERQAAQVPEKPPGFV